MIGGENLYLYLDADDVIRIYGRIFGIDSEAAANQLRDRPGLEGAIARPGNYAAYQGAELAMQAAVLAHGISEGQYFLDGNKRTALVAMTTFLAMNGADVALGDGRLAELILGFAEGDEPRVLADELRPSLVPRPE